MNLVVPSFGIMELAALADNIISEQGPHELKPNLRQMEPMGVEPTTSCMPCKQQPIVTVENTGLTTSNPQVCTSVCTGKGKTEHESGEKGLQTGSSDMPADPELAKLIIAWPKLPEAIRAAITAIVKAAETEAKKRP